MILDMQLNVLYYSTNIPINICVNYRDINAQIKKFIFNI